MAEHDCLNCRYVLCTNLGLSLKDRGGELWVLQYTVRERRWPPCGFGILLHALCRCLLQLFDLDQRRARPPVPPALFPLLGQALRDLKAAAFLALCGHYRSALQVLRPVLEGYLAAIYFVVRQEAVLAEVQHEPPRKRQQVLEEFWEEVERWLPGGHVGVALVPEKELRELRRHGVDWREVSRFGGAFVLVWLERGGLEERIPPMRRRVLQRYHILPVKEELQALKRLKHRLDRTLHPNPQSLEPLHSGCPLCHAVVAFNEVELQQVLEVYQEVCARMLHLLLGLVELYFPEEFDQLRQEVRRHLQALQKSGEYVKRELVLAPRLRGLLVELGV